MHTIFSLIIIETTKKMGISIEHITECTLLVESNKWRVLETKNQ